MCWRRRSMKKALMGLALAISMVGAVAVLPAWAAEVSPPNGELAERILERAEEVQSRAIRWRRDIHEHPELGNQETRTAGLVADHLRGLGMEVETGVGTTGVVGVLRGGKPGPVVALRADMDALPVKEATDLPYASDVEQMYQGEERSVMHACGHDAHVAILMATAEVLAGIQGELEGTVKFIFQSAEEGPSDYVYKGERPFGARQMIRAGALKDPEVDAIFGLHVTSAAPTGVIAYRSGPTMASSSDLYIDVIGSQTHAAQPWDGTDPVTTSAQIVSGLQTVVSRQTNTLSAPAVVSIGTINGGSRHNIIPERVEMSGTIRTFGEDVQKRVNERVKRTVENIAAAAGAETEVSIIENYATTVNDPALVKRMLPVLKLANGGNVFEAPLVTGSEDFSAYAQEVPGFYFFLGVTPGDRMKTAAPNHSPEFFVDDKGLVTGIRALSLLATDYLRQAQQE
ncbi:amidohydrolase [Ectothiorhodospiraceae bacterium WFHF3C12]|nr:amidohydrolase [Ectothiorhodospiraceae bacterium WFHF3C12]